MEHLEHPVWRKLFLIGMIFFLYAAHPGQKFFSPLRDSFGKKGVPGVPNSHEPSLLQSRHFGRLT
jgi:hypothetical protein